MKQIIALRSFSSHHGGTFLSGEVKEINAAEADMLIGMGFAMLVNTPIEEQAEKPIAKTAKKKPCSKS